MRQASLPLLFTGLFALAACSSGGSDNTAEVRIRCLNGQAFCIIGCDLGCSQTGCAVSEIAENQKLRFKFSDRVDPASVNSASISIRTASGVAPDGDFAGDFLVGGSEVTFVPRVRTVQGVSTFGFLRNESYIITLAGGKSGNQGVRSLAGDALAQEFTCTVRATLGIQDENQLPPEVELVAPTNLAAIPLSPTFVLRFSELIDTTALQSSLGEASPIRVVVRKTLSPGECDRDDEGVALEGLPQLTTEVVNGQEVTVVTFQPPVQLPGRACCIVYVSSDLRDLSGRAASPAQFEMFTVDTPSQPIQINESFANAAGQDPLPSGGIWNQGAVPGLLGGDGKHGSFKPSLGVPLGAGEFEWNVNQFTIPGSQTTSGVPELITDGKFYFTDFILPAGQTIKFLGTVAPQIYVRGKVEIHGSIKLNAPDMPFYVPSTGTAAGLRVSNFNSRSTGTTPKPGQVGGNGVCGGGKGGDGGTKCLSAGPIIQAGINLTDGQRGAAVSLNAAHAYGAQAGLTGGLGSPMNPANGLPQGAPLIQNLYRDEFSPGGAGGSFMLAGSLPTFPAPVLTGVSIGPGPNPALIAAFPLLPFPSVPPTPTYSSLDHFVVGGSGGGGGASHSFCTIAAVGDAFMAGHGGSGGGGALAIRAGGDLLVSSTAQLQAKGGQGVVINGDDPSPTSPTQDVNYGVSSPGGGGSGGSFLLQSARNLTMNGLIDTSGSLGSRTGFVNPATLSINAFGGAGSSGFYRLEAGLSVSVAPASGTIPAVGPDTVGNLSDRDDASGDVSTWRSSGRVFTPIWERYELDVDVNGVVTTYTDAPGGVLADGSGPVRIQFQGAVLNQSGQPKEGSIKDWRDRIASPTPAVPSINDDSVTGIRFRLIYNRAAFPTQVVKALRVFART